jgi:hypothetical protein
MITVHVGTASKLVITSHFVVDVLVLLSARGLIEDVEVYRRARNAVETSSLCHRATKMGLVGIHKRVTAFERARNGAGKWVTLHFKKSR